jgi:hypothetical protein
VRKYTRSHAATPGNRRLPAGAFAIIQAHGYIRAIAARKRRSNGAIRHRNAKRWLAEVCHSWFSWFSRFRKLRSRYEKLGRSLTVLNHLGNH